MKKLLMILGLISVLAGCTPEPVDPTALLQANFDTPTAASAIILSGGHAQDGWIVFRSQDRLQLKQGERFQVFDVRPAYDYFEQFIPFENLGERKEQVCLARRSTEGDQDHGAYLMFIPGSGLYHFREW